MFIDRVQPALGRQMCKDAHLRGDHPVGSNRQIMFRFQVDKTEQRNDKAREQRGYQ